MKFIKIQYVVFLFFFLVVTNYSGTVSGKVTDTEKGEPVADALVELVGINNTGPTGDSLFFSTNTDVNGEFLFENIPAGEFLIIVNAEGFQRFTSDNFELGENEVRSDFAFELEALLYYNLIGFVIDSKTEAKIPNALIVISNEIDARQTVSDQDGRYELQQVPEGSYSIDVSADGYKELGGNFLVVFEGTEQDQKLDIFLEPVIETSGKISGKVFFDDSGDPVGGAELEFINQNDGSFYTFSITASDGSYSVDIVPGNYIVRCTYIGPFSAFFYRYSEFYDDVRNPSDATLVLVNENEKKSNIDFGIPDPVGLSTITVSGKVTDTQNNPLENALITVENNPYIIPEFIGLDSTNYFTKTNIDGEYELTFDSRINPQSSFIVRVDADDHYPQYYDRKFSNISADAFFVFGDTTFTDIDFELVRYDDSNDGSISGRVTDKDGNSIAGTKVFFDNPLVLAFAPVFTETDSSGFYEMNGLMLGDYYVSFSAEGFVPELYDDKKKWDEAEFVVVQGKVENIDAQLDRVETGEEGNLIAGKIKSADDGSIIQGALVTLQNKNNESVKFAYSDNEGNYEIDKISPAEYTLVISHIDFHSESRPINITNNDQPLLVENASLFGRAITDVDDNNNTKEIPKEIQLNNNYPNPFNPSTTIEFGINQAQQVRLIIYNMLGQQVKELVNEFVPAGNYRLSWDAKDNNGNEVSTGIYLYSLEAGSFKQVKKMILAK